jgi:hypothetical protein
MVVVKCGADLCQSDGPTWRTELSQAVAAVGFPRYLWDDFVFKRLWAVIVDVPKCDPIGHDQISASGRAAHRFTIDRVRKG